MKIFLAIFLALSLLAGCGSDSKGDSETEVVDRNILLNVSGRATGFDLFGGNVVLYELLNGQPVQLIGSSQLSNSGFFSLDVNVSSNNPIVLACINGGSYTEPASLVSINLLSGDSICGITDFIKEGSFIDVTPITEVYYSLVNSRLEKGESLSSALSSAKSSFSSAYGFDPSTPVSSYKINTTGPNILSDSASYLFSISQFMLNESREKGNASHTYAYSTLSYIKAASRDASDGMLDGKSPSLSGDDVVNVGVENILFDGRTYSGDLAQSLVGFLAGETNSTGIALADVLDDQKRLASSSNPLFGANSGELNREGLDSENPVISSNIIEGVLVYNLTTVQFEASDNIGISCIEIYVDNVFVTRFYGNETTYVLDPENYLTGSHDLKAKAIDYVGNEIEVTKTFQINSDLPVLRLLSDATTDDSSYELIIEVIERDVSVSDIKVGGISVSVVSNNITASISLIEGWNGINISLTAGGDVLNYKYYVFLDTVFPVISVIEESSQFLVSYETNNGSSFLSKITFSAGGFPFYIPKGRESLNGLALNYENMKNDQYPIIRFTAVDSNELSIIGYEYIRDGALVVGRNFLESEKVDGFYFIPLADEYLGAGWANYDGIQTINIVVTDSAGNSSVSTREFTTYLENPRAEVLGTSGYQSVLSTNFPNLNLSIFDVGNITGLSFTISGEQFVASPSSSPVFPLNISNLSHGVNSGYLQVYSDGELVVSQLVDFIVDKTPPNLTSDANFLTKNGTLNVGGLVVDDYSNVENVSMLIQRFDIFDPSFELDRFFSEYEVDATLNAFNGNYDTQLTLVDGVYKVSSTATSNNGLSGSDYTVVEVDTSEPSISPYYPGRTYDVLYTTSVQSVPYAGQFENNSSASFYMPKSIMYLNGLEPTVENLIANGYIFYNGRGKDIFASGYGSGSEADELTVTYSFQVGGYTIFEDKPLTLNVDGEFTIPLTVDYVGEELINQYTYGQDANVNSIIKVKATDLAGNSKLYQFIFYRVYDPDNLHVN
jgi:hypothetical protein